MKSKKTISIILVLLTLLSFLPMTVSANDTQEFVIDDNKILTQYNGTDKEIAIPDGVKAIGDGVFYGKDITKVTIPASVETIGNNAFEASNIQNVEFSANSSLAVIGNYAFSQTPLCEIRIPKSVRLIDEGAFAGSTDLSSVYVYWTKAKEIALIISLAFDEDRLEDYTLYIPDGTKELYEENDQWIMFENVFEQEPDHVHSFSAYTDNGDRTHSKECAVCGLALKEKTAHSFTNDVCACGAKKFETDENGVLRQYNGADETVIIPDGVKEIDEYVFAGTEISHVTVSASVETIGNNAFEDCASLKTVGFAQGSKLKYIRDAAFIRSGVEEADIPASVAEIGDNAFVGCNALKSIYLNWTEESEIVTPLYDPYDEESICFESGVYSDCTLYVPDGTEELYKENEIWGKFKNIKKAAGENGISLSLDEYDFDVTAYGRSAGKGIVSVSLFGDTSAVSEVKTFDLAKNETPQGEFAEKGEYAKAFWWESFETMKPVCKPAEDTAAKPLVKIDFIVDEIINGVNYNQRYYPVFNIPPEGVTFYGNDGTEYNSMNDNITYAMAHKGVVIHTLRDVKESWNGIFVDDLAGYPYNATEVREAFIDKYLSKGKEFVYGLNGNQAEREIYPMYNDVGISNIWNAYKNAGFADSNGCFWSFTKINSNYANCYYCRYDSWLVAPPDILNCILISRDFNS